MAVIFATPTLNGRWMMTFAKAKFAKYFVVGLTKMPTTMIHLKH